MKKIDFWKSLFNPDSIAVIGASDVPRSWGYQGIMAAKLAVQRDSKKKIYAVNPKAQEILGVKSYASILDIPGPVELAVIVIRADRTPLIMHQCVEKGVKAAVVISAGFAELDSEGAKLQAEVVEIAKKGGIRFVGPNCAGHFNFNDLYGTSLDVSEARPGKTALISQSGTLSGIIILKASELGVGSSKFVSTGNEADLHFEDYLEYLGEDPDTGIITGYIEGLREGRRFYELAKKITVNKPIVVIKTGSTEGSSSAAQSHTGALAGGETAYNAAFKQAGVIRAEDDEELCDVTLLLNNMPLPKGRRVGVVTVGGGYGVMTAEACEKEGLLIPKLDPITIEKMSAILPPQWSKSNPADLVNIVASDDPMLKPKCLTYLMEDKNLDALIALLTPEIVIHNAPVDLSPENIKEMQTIYLNFQKFLSELAYKYGKPIIMLETYFNKLPSIIADTLPDIGIRIPAFPEPKRAAKALRHLVQYSEYLQKVKGEK